MLLALYSCATRKCLCGGELWPDIAMALYSYGTMYLWHYIVVPTVTANATVKYGPIYLWPYILMALYINGPM